MRTDKDRVTTYLGGISGWKDYEAILDDEKQRYEELVSAKNLGTDDEANTFKPGQQYEKPKTVTKFLAMAIWTSTAKRTSRVATVTPMTLAFLTTLTWTVTMILTTTTLTKQKFS